MSWYDPFKLKRRKWSERSPTGKKIYVIYYLILVSVLGVILWIGEFSEEAQTRDQQKMLEWQESRKKEALKQNKILKNNLKIEGLGRLQGIPKLLKY